eukprot:1152897-Pelagomonas_calceolata.AAC.9
MCSGFKEWKSIVQQAQTREVNRSRNMCSGLRRVQQAQTCTVKRSRNMCSGLKHKRENDSVWSSMSCSAALQANVLYSNT